MSDSRTETPFQVRTTAPAVSGIDGVDLPEVDSELSLEELEAAYLRALEASDAVEASLDVPLNESISDIDEPTVRTDDGRTTAVTRPDEIAPTPSRITQQAVLEALLFVGGASLTTRKLADVLGLRDADAIDPLIRELADKYEQECRPYTVAFHQGGYRLELLLDFEPVRRKVHGLSPKEVRLSQEALEILALVAYRQPLSNQDPRLTERKNAQGMLRQLLRRELVSLQREEGDAKRVIYNTTPRFLQLFGIGSLDDLPYPEDLEFK